VVVVVVVVIVNILTTSSSQDESDSSMTTHGKSPEDESDSEYDDDCQDHVANGTMVDYVTDELSQHTSTGHDNELHFA